MAWDGGYEQQRISENEYLVSFHGNSFTKYETVVDFALLRAAEIGEKLGYEYLSVEARGDRSRSIQVEGTTSSTTTGSGYKVGNAVSYTANTTTTPSTYTAFKPRMEVRVRYFVTKPEGRFLELHRVPDVLREIRAKHEIK
jgi:hypothetical protein